MACNHMSVVLPSPIPEMQAKKLAPHEACRLCSDVVNAARAGMCAGCGGSVKKSRNRAESTTRLEITEQMTPTTFQSSTKSLGINPNGRRQRHRQWLLGWRHRMFVADNFLRDRQTRRNETGTLYNCGAQASTTAIAGFAHNHDERIDAMARYTAPHLLLFETPRRRRWAMTMRWCK